MKKIFFFLFVIFTTQSYAYEYFVVPYFSYKTHLYFRENNRYSENFQGIGIEGGYVVTDFLQLTIFLERSSLYGIGKEVDSFFQNAFPEKAERKLYNFGLKSEFFFFTNPENLFYFGPSLHYTILPSLIYNKTIYPESANNFFQFGFFLGNRFLLFPRIVFCLEADFTSSFKKFFPPLDKNKPSFSQYFIHLKLGIGVIF